MTDEQQLTGNKLTINNHTICTQTIMDYVENISDLGGISGSSTHFRNVLRAPQAPTAWQRDKDILKVNTQKFIGTYFSNHNYFVHPGTLSQYVLALCPLINCGEMRCHNIIYTTSQMLHPCWHEQGKTSRQGMASLYCMHTRAVVNLITHSQLAVQPSFIQSVAMVTAVAYLKCMISCKSKLTADFASVNKQDNDLD